MEHKSYAVNVETTLVNFNLLIELGFLAVPTNMPLYCLNFKSMDCISRLRQTGLRIQTEHLRELCLLPRDPIIQYEYLNCLLQEAKEEPTNAY